MVLDVDTKLHRRYRCFQREQPQHKQDGTLDAQLFACGRGHQGDHQQFGVGVVRFYCLLDRTVYAGGDKEIGFVQCNTFAGTPLVELCRHRSDIMILRVLCCT